MARTCIFCPGTNLSLEHVFGKRSIVAKFLPPGSDIHSNIAIRHSADAETKRGKSVRHHGAGGGLEVKTVCKACNEGWMESLDNEVFPLLWHLAYAEEGEVECPGGHHLLARWATKIALVMDSATRPLLVTRFDREGFKGGEQPLANATVWIAAMEKAPHEFRQLASSFGLRKDPEKDQLYVATFRILHVVFQVVIPLNLELVAVRRSGFSEIVQRLWPPEGAIGWPPPAGVWLPDEEAFSALAAAFEMRAL